MTDYTQEKIFTEYTAFKTPQGTQGTGMVFENWNPFQSKQLEGRPSAEQVLRQKEQELEEKARVLRALEEQLNEREQILNEMIKSVKSVVEEFQTVKKTHWEVNLNEIVEFAMGLAEKITLQTLAIDPTILVGQIRSSLEQIKDEESIRIHMNPEDLDFLQKSKKETVTSLLGQQNIFWNGDMRLSRGEVFIDAEQYRLDASLNTMMQNLKLDLLAGKAAGTMDSTEGHD